MKKTYTIYGSCQASALASILNSNDEFKSQYQYQPMDAIYVLTESDIENLNTNIFPKLDLFIYLPTCFKL